MFQINAISARSFNTQPARNNQALRFGIRDQGYLEDEAAINNGIKALLHGAGVDLEGIHVLRLTPTEPTTIIINPVDSQVTKDQVQAVIDHHRLNDVQVEIAHPGA